MVTTNKQKNRLVGNKITSIGASLLLNTLKECNIIVLGIWLAANPIDDECMKSVGEFVQDNQYLKRLCIGSNITDNGIKILSEYLFGNIVLQNLSLNINAAITNNSGPFLIEMVQKSAITEIEVLGTSIGAETKQEIQVACNTDVEKREIPVRSNTKSAAKIASASTST